MAGSLTVLIYLNVRNRAVYRKASVRPKRALNCDFRHPFAMKLPDERQLGTGPRPPPKTPTVGPAISLPKSHLLNPETLIETPIQCCSGPQFNPSLQSDANNASAANS